MNWIQWNWKYIRVVNGCDNGKLQALYADISKLPGAFIRRRYIWNLLRGKTFYINAASYVIENVELAKTSIDLNPDHQMDDATNQLMNDTNTFIRELLASEPNEQVKRSFVWRITKHAPLITSDILPYMGAERVKIILNGDWAINDQALSPIIDIITELRTSNDTLREMMNSID